MLVKNQEGRRMIRFLRSRNEKSAFVVDNVLFFNSYTDPEVKGAYVAIKDENGKPYLVIDGDGPYSTYCLLLDSMYENLMMIRAKALFYEVLSREILTEEYDHYIVRPVFGGEKFLATYESSTGDAMLVRMTPIPEWVKDEDDLIFDKDGEFIRPCL